MKPSVRHVARIIVTDPARRILLLRYALPYAPVIWACSGGGLEPGESYEQAAHRELREELGLENCVLGPCIWVREFAFPHQGSIRHQTERFFFCQVAPFDPPSTDQAELVREGILEIRWWTQEELRAAQDVTFAPRRLVELLAQLQPEGLPREPLAIGL